MLAQETHRALKSQQIWMRVIHMHYLNTTYPPDHHYNDFMAIVALGQTHVYGSANLHI